MAEKSSGSGDWTAGIVAIVAALLLGGGIPIGLYFGLYTPKVADREAAQKKLSELNTEMEILLARAEDVRELEEDGDDMAARLEKLESRFVIADASDKDKKELKVAASELQTLADRHDLRLLRQRESQAGATTVFAAVDDIKFEKGLTATKYYVEAQARFHDFGRFLSEIETLPTAVVIPDTLRCIGDSNGGERHIFQLAVYILVKRDIEMIGR